MLLFLKIDLKNLLTILLKTSSNMISTRIFIDGSYFIFYRFFAIMQWWRNARPELCGPEFVPIDNEEFVEKFRSTFVSNLKTLKKKLKLPKDTDVELIVGKDAPRKTLWRMAVFPEYKACREKQHQGFQGGPFFKMVYDDRLFEEGGVTKIMSYPSLEADDTIALSILNSKPNNSVPDKVILIASDHDYLQLLGNVPYSDFQIISLKMKPLHEPGDDKGQYYLMEKILSGDKSDGIPPAFPKCGKVTANKCIHEPGFLEKKISKNADQIKINMKMNKTLVDFTQIPLHLQEGFLKQNWE
jgi:5'-3' exonuclease